MIDTATPPKVFGLTPVERRAVETLYRAFNEADPDLLDTAVTEDWQDTPLAPHQKPGRDGMKPLIGEFVAAFPDVRITLFEIIGAPGRAAVRGRISGTHTGEWFGIAPTGKPFEMPMHEFHHIADGKLTHTWHLEDWFGWLFQVGAWPAGAR
ncbi:ester cyclase [Inquilinus sp. Marseille-Q2685]|uniref:ester cyclase n=1 Tax=Inquilinus sp. Marseille-Q2685 TaxID=2866581 RepID=UPI001CE40520|nr:ester cyclase [Inquilinus sp. Marseille-Q2685]